MKHLPKLVVFLFAYAVLCALAILGRRAFWLTVIVITLVATARACAGCR